MLNQATQTQTDLSVVSDGDEPQKGAGAVLAVFRDGAGRMGMTPLQMQRVAVDGIEATAARRIRPGQRVTLRGVAATNWESAIATSCDRDGEGWRIGLARAA